MHMTDDLADPLHWLAIILMRDTSIASNMLSVDGMALAVSLWMRVSRAGAGCKCFRPSAMVTHPYMFWEVYDVI